jgi:hypothetical protein
VTFLEGDSGFGSPLGDLIEGRGNGDRGEGDQVQRSVLAPRSISICPIFLSLFREQFAILVKMGCCWVGMLLLFFFWTNSVFDLVVLDCNRGVLLLLSLI